MRLRSWLYAKGKFASYRADCRVISVGNITVGGTGKTPITMALTRALAASGRKVAVVSRGYRGSLEGQTAIVSDGNEILLDAAQAGDEPVMLARVLSGVPVLIGARRPEAVKLAVERFGVEAVICDDAFSHLALQRDCDIVLVHGRDGLGNGRCTPAGPLREPCSALARANVLVLNTTSGEDPRTLQEIVRTGYRGEVLRLRYADLQWRNLRTGEIVEPQTLPDRRVIAFAATARPEDVFVSFAASGWEVAEKAVWPDHYAYRPTDLERLAQLAAGKGICYLATTEKDAVKCPQLKVPGVELVVASIRLAGENEALRKLIELVEERCWPNRLSSSTVMEP